MYNILILGQGGREHTFAWKIGQSPLCNALFIAPGNPGTAEHGQNLALDIMDFNQILEAVDTHKIDLIVVGPEAPLVAGIADFFENHPVKVIGPSQDAARLEGSKSFANAFMAENNIPTAGSVTIDKDNIEKGHAFIDKQASKIVLKADGLAAGKGVIILDDKEEAKTVLADMLNGKFGKASEQVVLEEFLDGIEFSVFVLTNGSQYKVLPIAKDYKRIGEGDTGLNTGGMGAVSPVPFVDDSLMRKVEDKIIKPTIKGLQKDNQNYKGFIFLGLIKVDNEPFVIEYNCRMGDPETEVVLPRLKNDLVELFNALFDNTLDNINIESTEAYATTVMLVSGGYPEAYQKSKKIQIIKSNHNALIFHAGTKLEGQNLVTNGGRVLAITSFANNINEAVKLSLDQASNINFEGMYYRTDIGFDL